MQLLKLEFDGKVGVFTVVGYYKDKKNHTEWSLFPCTSLALFAALSVTSKVLNAVVVLNSDNEYHLILTIYNDKERIHSVKLSIAPHVLYYFPRM